MAVVKLILDQEDFLDSKARDIYRTHNLDVIELYDGDCKAAHFLRTYARKKAIPNSNSTQVNKYSEILRNLASRAVISYELAKRESFELPKITKEGDIVSVMLSRGKRKNPSAHTLDGDFAIRVMRNIRFEQEESIEDICTDYDDVLHDLVGKKK